MTFKVTRGQGQGQEMTSVSLGTIFHRYDPNIRNLNVTVMKKLYWFSGT